MNSKPSSLWQTANRESLLSAWWVKWQARKLATDGVISPLRSSGRQGTSKKIGLWIIIVAHNLPYPDARCTGKIPKLLLHRMVPNARYSIWLDGKLELVVDPYQILERRLVSSENMKLKELKGFLGCLDQFPHPKVELEQYPTGPYIAPRMLFTVENYFGDVSDKVVADFGCGCGTLGIAAAILSAKHVLSIDIYPESLEIALLNAEEIELDMDFIQSNVLDLGWRGSTVDKIITNPPFGTRKKGADLDFLSAAFKIASQAVYSLHKTKKRDHVKRAAMRDFNASSAEVLCELRFDVPKLYKFHKKKEVDIAVDLWRFVPAKHQSRGI